MQNNKKEKLLRFRAAGKYLLSSPSIFGLPRVMNTNNYLVKAIWITMIISSAFFGLYTCSKSIRNFLNYDVITHNEIIEATSLTFPAITFCSNKVQGDNSSPDLFFTSCIYGIYVFFCKESNYENFYIFKNYYFYSCLRINGFKNKSTELRKSNSTGYVNGLHLKFDLKFI